MMLGKYFKKTVFRKEHTADGVVPEAPQGILKKCNACKGAIFTEDVKRNLYICPKCGNYFRVHAYRRIEFLLDDGSFEEWDQGMTAGNPLGFPGYEEKMRALQERTGLTEAVVTGKGRINGMETVIGVCDGRFMMASMGEAVGEKITRAVERATKLSLPVILFACSGGARMQEGIVSLMQMAKTSAALKRHSDAGLLYVSVLTDPTTGGVTPVVLCKSLVGLAPFHISDKIAQTAGLGRQFGHSLGRFVHGGGSLPGHVVDLDYGLVNLLAGGGLLLAGRGNGADLVRRAAYALHNLVQGRAGILRISGGFFHRAQS